MGSNSNGNYFHCKVVDHIPVKYMHKYCSSQIYIETSPIESVTIGKEKVSRH